MRRARSAERPGHSATTAHFQAAYPFVAEGGLGAPGAYIGRDAYGGAWLYDPWSLYERGILAGPNMLVIGGIGSAKSSLVKTYLLRQRVFGRQAWVLDPKSEYAPLARALGSRPIALAPGGEVRLNPLSPRGGARGTAQPAALGRPGGAAARARSRGGRRAAGGAQKRRRNRERRSRGDAADDRRRAARPRPEMVAGVAARTKERFAAANRNVALALQRLCEGDLRGMFDGPTSAGLDLDAPLVVLDLSAVQDSAALGILMTCAAAWMQGIVMERKRSAESGGGPGREDDHRPR